MKQMTEESKWVYPFQKLICFLFAIALLCGTTVSCVGSKSNPRTTEQLTNEEEEWYWNEKELVDFDYDVSSDLLDYQKHCNFEFEHEMADRYYVHGITSLEDEDDPAYRKYCAFDDDGNGVCMIVDVEARACYFESTTDYGKTWKLHDKGTLMGKYASYTDMIVWKGRVLLPIHVEEKSYIEYTDDMFRTVYRSDIAAKLDIYKKVLCFDMRDMKILNIEEDGAVVFGWYDLSKSMGGEKRYYLIVKTDRDFDHVDLLYADDTYIKKKKSY